MRAALFAYLRSVDEPLRNFLMGDTLRKADNATKIRLVAPFTPNSKKGLLFAATAAPRERRNGQPSKAKRRLMADSSAESAAPAASANISESSARVAATTTDTASGVTSDSSLASASTIGIEARNSSVLSSTSSTDSASSAASDTTLLASASAPNTLQSPSRPRRNSIDTPNSPMKPSNSNTSWAQSFADLVMGEGRRKTYEQQIAQKALADREGEHQKLLSENTDLKRKNFDLEALLNIIRQDAGKLQELQDTLAKAKEKLLAETKLKESVLTAKEQLEALLQGANGSIEQLHGQLRELADQRTELEAQLASSNVSLNQEQEKNAAIAAEKLTLKATIVASSNVIAERVTENTTLREQIEQNNAQIKDLVEVRDQLLAEKEAIQKQLADVEQTLQTTSANLVTQTERTAQLIAQLSN